MFRILTLLVLSSYVLSANMAKQIVALEYATGTLTQSYGASSTADNQTVTQYGFKLGAKENDYRLFISYRYQDIDSQTGYHIGLEFDAFYQMGAFGIYLGPVAGYSWYDFAGQDTTARSVTLPYYGGNTGVTLDLGIFELDAGARYAYYMDATVDSVASQVYTVNNMLTYYVGLNYVY